MSRRPSLQDFVEDEMLRAPLTYDQVLDAVQDRWRAAPGTQTRSGSEPARQLQNCRSDLVNAAVLALRQQVRAALQATASGAATPGTAAGGAPAKLVLSLIDEDAVAADIEVARAVERVKSTAEFELRELQAFTSALVGDFNVSRDTNPFRPEAYVRALWEGVQSAPMPAGTQVALLRDSAEPLAKALRQGYAAACSRLEEQGVEPAAYRTIVVTPAGRAGTEAPVSPLTTTLHQMRDNLSRYRARAAAAAPRPAPLPAAPAAVPASAAMVDPQLVELLSRLFDAIQSDREIPSACMGLLLRLHPTTLRLAVLDPAILDDYDHPVWRFMDQLAHLLGTVHAAELDRCLNFARQLVEHLVADGAADVARFAWALGRLQAYERHSFDRALQLAEPEIEQLFAPADDADEALDVGTLDTVPAELMPEVEPSAATQRTAALHQRPGDHLRAYLQGAWRLLQLLWMDRSGETWLLRDIAANRHWAVRLPAMERLFAAELAAEVRPRSLVRGAAMRVLRSLDPATPLPD